MHNDFKSPDSPDQIAVLAADVGGTRLRAAAILADGTVALRRERPTRFERGPHPVADDIAGLLAEVADAAARQGLPVGPGAAIAATGPIDATGSLVDPSNLGPAFRGFPLGAEVARRLGREVRVGLDTHLALLGELDHGALRGTRDALYVTVSTGVGGAMLAGGRLVVGADGLAGEVGHLPVMAGGPRCGCGGRGHLEAVASGPAIAAAGETAARSGRSEELARRMAAAPDGRLTGRDVAQAAEAGDAVAGAIMARARAVVARAGVGLVDLLNPERVVLGGGVILGDPPSWLGAVRRGLDRTGLAVHAARVEVVLPALGDDAGLVGCRPFLLGASRRA
ncbi:MAG: ROK family protein [Chloroflexota bacterium]